MTYKHFKNRISSGIAPLPWFYEDRSDSYRLISYEGPLIHECILIKVGGPKVVGVDYNQVAIDQNDFETNYKDQSAVDIT